VAVLPGTGLDASGGSAEYVRLHFLASPADLRESVRRLAAAWQSYEPDWIPAAPTMAI